MKSIVIVGRPNVGKSSLFNRLTKTRDAIVADMPGLTRDRHYGKLEIQDSQFLLVDTGGFEPKNKEGIVQEMALQTKQAIDESDIIIFMVDSRKGLHTTDEHIADIIRRNEKPKIIAVNKAEGILDEKAFVDFYSLGFSNLVRLSSAHGEGISALKDFLLTFDEIGDEEIEDKKHPKISIVGKPNVGKSTLINGLLGEDRFIAFDQPGTTRDAISTEFFWGKETYTLTDTAGIRKKGKVFETIEKFSIIKTLNAIEQSNIAVLLIDGKDGLSAQDLHILAFVIETGRSLVVAVNKWDLLDDYEKDKIKNQIDRKLSFVNFAEVVFISAINKRGFSEMMRAIKKAYQSSQKKLSTPQINSVLENALIAHPPKIIKGIRPKLKYAHQGGLNPPQIIIHGNHLNEIKKDYIVFLESFFRKSFQLVGTPIKVLLKNSENPFDKKDLKPRKTGLVTRRKIKNEYREKLNKKNIPN